MKFPANKPTETTRGEPRQLDSNPALRRYQDVRELIANRANPTPLVRSDACCPPGDFHLYAKLEWFQSVRVH